MNLDDIAQNQRWLQQRLMKKNGTFQSHLGGFIFMLDELKKELDVSVTENGARGHATSGSLIVDFNFMASSMRAWSGDEIRDCFLEVYHDDPLLALRWLFYARDIRMGMGERRLFRECYKVLPVPAAVANLTNIPFYGRWDDLVSLFGVMGSVVDEAVVRIVSAQLDMDLLSMERGGPVSLLAKWMPSENASSVESKRLARKLAKALDLSFKEYRKTLSSLRGYIDVVESRMCSGDWSGIDYEKVPSMANLRYADAFMRHDYDRRARYLSRVSNGDADFNMSVASPVDVVHRYVGRHRSPDEQDDVLELAWKSLSDVFVDDVLVVADGSGSMTWNLSGVLPLTVANSLALYTAEHNSGEFRNHFITFSSHPRLIRIPEDATLYEKLRIMSRYMECSSTNIEAVFDLILDAAVNNEMTQDDMPGSVLVISDMEFNQAVSGGPDRTLFDEIKSKYKAHGFVMPRLVFWNVSSRTGTIPVRTNNMGVALVSGYSQNTRKMVMSDKLDPYEVLVETLMSPRYDRVVPG